MRDAYAAGATFPDPILVVVDWQSSALAAGTGVLADAAHSVEVAATARDIGNEGPQTIAEVEEELGVGDDGLSSVEAARRRESAGLNELPTHETHAILRFFSYLWGPIPWMIESAIVLSLLVRHWEDFAIISTLLVANAIVGFWEEYQAGNAIAALRSRLALRARVRRDGVWGTVEARELVPGDLIRVRLGDIVPADAVLLSEGEIEVDESALTGESLPVTHTREGTVYSGSVIRRGEASALVSATGGSTFFGKTAALVESTNVVSHFQRAVLRIGNYLIALDGVMVAIILVAAIVRGTRLTTTLEFVLVLTVAAIPVAMPVVLSVTLAVGARLLAVQEAIVSRLASIEELAGMDVLCTDKTGTLTQNRLSLGEPFAVSGVEPAEVIRAAALCSREEDQDTVDVAVLAGAPDAVQSGVRILDFLPFDPVRKRTEATIAEGDRQYRVSKGAPQVILQLVAGDDGISGAVQAAVGDFASRGYRSLGVARTDDGGDWHLLGILPLSDPPREDTASTIAAAAGMGLDIKMVTGDQVAIGREIATRVGLKANIIDASTLDEISDDIEEQGRLVEADRRFRPGLPRAQVPDHRSTAASRPHCRNDGRRGERRAGP